MENTLQQVILNYSDGRLLGKLVHVKGIKNGEEVFNGYYEINATIETNYSRISIMWDKDGVLPMEYQEHYSKNSNKYPVDFKYSEMSDKFYLSGKYSEEPYAIEIQFPGKESND